MNAIKFLSDMPDVKKAVVVLSGGMDSTIAARLAVEKYGSRNVHALTFFYQQKQSIEIDFAELNSKKLNLAKHMKVDIGFLGHMVRGVSANIVGGQSMPTIEEILGDPAPLSEVPFRNGILMMISAAYAQSNGLQAVITGIQAQDQYSYWDTTPAFIKSMNAVISQNRIHSIKFHAPWQGINKSEEIKTLIELDGDIKLLENTITCYNPSGSVSCGKCPSCSERIAAFMKLGLKDPISYSIDFNWN